MDWQSFEQETAMIAESLACNLRRGHDIRSFDFLAERADAQRLVADLSDDWLPALYLIDLPHGSGRAAVAKFASTVFRGDTRSRYEGLPALPRISAEPPSSDCLYVGKVGGPWVTRNRLTVRRRLHQHLAWGNELTCRKTSACRLQMWLPDECWPVRVRGAIFAPRLGEETVFAGLAEFLENKLWLDSQPLLGQRGGH